MENGGITIAVETEIENAYGGDGNDIVNGNSVANVLYGMRGDDHLNGAFGNDTLCGGAGNDSIDGGTGIDIALYSGVRSGYALAKISNGFTLTNITGMEGIDTLQNVERLKFFDRSIALDTGVTQSGGESALLLGAVLGQAALSAKKPLVGVVMDLFDQGLTMQQLSGAFMRLPIWGLLANGGNATASNTQIATYLLTTVNGSAPDAATLSTAVTSLTNDPQGDFLWHLAASSANQTQVGLVGLATTGLEFEG